MLSVGYVGVGRDDMDAEEPVVESACPLPACDGVRLGPG